MAKKTRKKAARRKVAKKKTGVRKAAGSSLRTVSTGELQAELQRRSQDLAKLEAKRDALLDEVEMIESEISVISAAIRASNDTVTRKTRTTRITRKKTAGRPQGTRSRKRPRNEASLEVSLAKVLQGKTMGVSEVAEAVKKAGYKTSSPNFRTIVNQALIRSDLIKKVGRGAYTAK